VNDDGLTAGAVARRLGVAVTTLRTWHQRYDLGPSAHEPGKHRRYTPEDLARLELMQRLTADGVPSGEAARWVRSRNIATALTPRPIALSSPATNRNGTGEAARDGARDGGGHNLPLGPASPAARGLGRAAMRLDAESVRQIASDAVRHLGVVRAWDSVLRPVLAAIGERHGRTGGLIEVEHLVSAVTSDVFGAVPRPHGNGRGRVLLACTDEEQHSLPLEALSAALAQVHIMCRLLGARVPLPALRAAVRRTGPAAVLLWSQSPKTASPEQLTALSGDRTRPLLLAAAGPGWDRATLPPGVATPQTLGEAVDLLRAAV
jgi:MerR family transcriptional regulator, light-induced transcriptional regulator